MAPKKQDDSFNPEASFFGEEDLDWLQEDAKEAPVEPPESLPVAPPPPPPYVPPAGALPSDAAVRPVSSQTVLPPEDASEAPTESALLGGRLAFIDADDPPTLEVDPTSEEVIRSAETWIDPEPPADEPAVAVSEAAGDDENDGDEDEAVPFTEDALVDEAESVPLVRTHEPAPPREATAGAGADEEVGFTPAAPRVRYTPAGDREFWSRAARALVIESARASGDARGHDLYAAATIHRAMLGDDARAETLIQDAHSAGYESPELYRDLAELAQSRGDQRAVVDAWERHASLVERQAAVEALLLAAQVASHDLKDPREAARILRQALDVDPSSFAVFVHLRQVLDALGDHEGRIALLERVAETTTGRYAAELWWERGHYLQEIGRHRDAQDSFRAALEAAPTHAQAFLDLEEILVNLQDARGLAELYQAEATRDGQDEAAWWHLKVARLLCDSDAATAEAAFDAALELGDPQARREHQAWLTTRGRFDALEASCTAEAEALGDAGAFAWFRVARVRERHLGDAEGALAAYREVLRLDPAAGPASEAIGRLLQRTGRSEELLALLDERLTAASDPNEEVSLLLRIGEIAENVGDQARARVAWEAIHRDISPGYLPAMEGLQRVFARLEAWDELSELLVQRAELTVDPQLKAQYLFRAGGALAHNAVSAEGAAHFEAALAAVPDHAASLDALELALGDGDAWDRLAAAVESAADATTDEGWRIALYYRAGRLWAGPVGDRERALSALGRCLDLSPQFPPALQLLKELAAQGGATEELLALERREADLATGDAADWRRLAAADLAAEVSGAAPTEDLTAILARDPAHAGGRAAMELVAMQQGDVSGLVRVYQWALDGVTDPAERARVGSQLVDILRQRWDSVGAREALESLDGLEAELPARALSRDAEALGLLDAAARLLARKDAPHDRFERARILLRGDLGQRDEAVDILRSLLDVETCADMAALMLARVAREDGKDELRDEAWRWLAEHGHSDAIRLTHALWHGARRLESGDADAARVCLTRAVEIDAASELAFRGLQQLATEARDVDALRELYATHRPDEHVGLARALESVDEAASIEAWRASLDDAPSRLPRLFHLEAVLTSTKDWRGVFDVVSERATLHRDVAERDAAEAKRRWLLAEKLATTDEAWELYQALHEEDPEDREVTEALARIAGARGETEVAVGYLKDLAESAEKEAAVRYQRRIGEAYEAAERAADARQAYLDALDHVPDDAEALAGLKRLAEAESDWAALVGVLRREANLSSGERKLAALRDIASTVETHLDDAAQAIDAWREVLEHHPGDVEGLQHVLALSEVTSQWDLFVEMGTELLLHREGAERNALLCRMGVACQDHLARDDAFRYFEQAIAEAPEDLEAAARLEEIYRERRDFEGVVRCLVVRGRRTEDGVEAAGHYVDAARLELESRHDRERAAALYAEAIQRHPDHADALRFQSAYLYESGSLEAALPLYERLEPFQGDQDLDDFDVRLDLSSFYFQFGEMLSLTERTEDAIARFEQALELNPAHLPSLRAVGPLYLATETWKKAERVFRQLLQLTGGQGERSQVAATYTQLGLVERALGSTDKAYKRFTKALEIHPNHLEALKGLALVLEDRKDWNNLLNIYNNIIYHATVPGDVVRAYMTKGRVLDEEMGRPDKAAQHYERSLAFDANQPVALLRLAEIALRSKQWNEAGGLAQRGLRLLSARDRVRGELLAAQAVARRALGDETRAFESLAEARETHPPLADAWSDEGLADLEAFVTALRQRLPR